MLFIQNDWAVSRYLKLVEMYQKIVQLLQLTAVTAIKGGCINDWITSTEYKYMYMLKTRYHFPTILQSFTVFLLYNPQNIRFVVVMGQNVKNI